MCTSAGTRRKPGSTGEAWSEEVNLPGIAEHGIESGEGGRGKFAVDGDRGNGGAGADVSASVLPSCLPPCPDGGLGPWLSLLQADGHVDGCNSKQMRATRRCGSSLHTQGKGGRFSQRRVSTGGLKIESRKIGSSSIFALAMMPAVPMFKLQDFAHLAAPILNQKNPYTT
eukprot:1161147-Pelagomonas_calceolata.AAC.9